MAKAIQRLLRDDQGRLKVILIDAETLQPILNPEGYQVINGQTTYWEPVADVANPDVPSKVQLSASRLNEHIRRAEGDPNRVPVVPTPAEKQADLATRQTVRPSTTSTSVRPTTVSDTIPSSPGDEVKALASPTSLPASVQSEVAPQRGGLTVGIPGTQYGGIDPQHVKPEVTKERVTGVDVTPPEMADMRVEQETRGMAALAGKYGKHRPNPPSTEVSDKVRQAAMAEFGPGATVVATSGTEGNLPQYGSNRHKTTKAMDFHVEVDGQKVTDQARLDRFAERASTLGIMGTGAGPEYMGDGVFHMDTVDPSTYTGVQDRAWGSVGNRLQNKLESAEYFGNIKEDRKTPGIPTPAPADIRSEALGAPKPTAAQESISSVVDSRIQGDPSKVSPAQMAGLGLMTHPRTEQEIDTMARAFAGELSPQSREALAKGDETARQELANMITTAENRIGKNKSFDKTFKPSQYNSLMGSKKKVTDEAYAKHGAAIKQAVKDFYTGDLKPSTYEKTNYFNPDIADPDWGPGMTDPENVGEHTFGAVGQWGTKGTDLSGRATGPTEGGVGRFGTGGLGRGLDSPSETSGIGRGSQLGHSGLLGSPGFGRSGLGSGRPSVESDNSGGNRSTSTGNYSGFGGQDSPSESSGVGRGMGLGASSRDKDKDKDKDSGRSQGPSGGGYGGWGGPR